MSRSGPLFRATLPSNRLPWPARAFALIVSTGLSFAAVWGASSALAAETMPRRSPTWADIDTLRTLLMANGARVVQQDCNQPGLQGLYHGNSGTIVICRVHRDPAAVWNTLAHEATHRMQDCAGGPITHAAHHQAMAQALASGAPQEWRSLRSYPRSEQLSELEARYTARLAPEQVPRLFRRYCGGPTPSTLTQRP
jgi:hypothetical protein